MPEDLLSTEVSWHFEKQLLGSRDTGEVAADPGLNMRSDLTREATLGECA